MNRKAIQLTISTLILIILGIAVLIALIIALTGGFERFRDTTDPYLDTTEAIAVKQSCELACDSDSIAAFCCNTYELNGEQVYCSNNILGINCPDLEEQCSVVDCLPE